MRNPKSTLLGSVVLTMGLAGPALAHDDDDHDDEHDQLGWEHTQDHRLLQNRHAYVHDDLAAEHDMAHYNNPYMSRKAHRRLHKQIGQEHAWRDRQLNWQHDEMHRALDDEHDAYHNYYYDFRDR